MTIFKILLALVLIAGSLQPNHTETRDISKEAQNYLSWFLQNFSEEIQVDDDFTDFGNWYSIEYLLKDNTLPFFAGLTFEFFKKEKGVVFSEFYTILDNLYADFPDREQFEKDIRAFRANRKQKEDRNHLRIRTVSAYDLRALPYILQQIARRGMKTNIMEFFPVDRDKEAVSFLKDYIWYEKDPKWTDAACILSHYLTRKEFTDFGTALQKIGEKTKGFYLLDLAENGCPELAEAMDKNRSNKLLLPFGIRVYPSDWDAPKETLKLLKNNIYHFNELACKKDCISHLKNLSKTGNLMKRIAALDLLSSLPSVGREFFIQTFEKEKNDWIRTVCLWGLKKKSAVLTARDIPVHLIRESLDSDNPFLVLLAMQMANKSHETDLKYLFLEGNKLYQKEILKRVHEWSGYTAVKECFNTTEKEKISLFSKIFVLQKAYENRDTKILKRYFALDTRPELLCPAARALFLLEKEKIVNAVINMLTEGVAQLREKVKQKKLSVQDFEVIVKTFISILGQSKDKRAIPILTGFTKLKDFRYAARSALRAIKVKGESKEKKEKTSARSRQENPPLWDDLEKRLRVREKRCDFVKYLKHYPDKKGLAAAVELIENRCYDVWGDLESILWELVQKIPDQVKAYLHHRDIEVRKKIVAAFRGSKSIKDWEEFKGLIAHSDISLAIWAFDTCKTHFNKRDFNRLVSFYRRVKVDSIKIEIMEVIAPFCTQEAAVFLKEIAAAGKYTGEHADLYKNFNDADSLVSFLRQTENPGLFDRGMERLLEIDRNKGTEALLDFYLNFKQKRKSFREKNKVKPPRGLSEKAKRPSLPITIKIPSPIEKSVPYRKIHLPTRDKGAWVRFCRLYRVGERYFYFQTEEIDITRSAQPKICRVIHSDDLEKWSTPFAVEELMRIEHPFMTAYPDGSYLLCYLRCSDPQSRSDPRPYLVPFDREKGFKKGFFPLEMNRSYSAFTLFQFKRNYFIAAIPEGRKDSDRNRFEIYRSPSLDHWNAEPEIVRFPENIYSLDIKVFNDKLYCLRSGNLYQSTDTLHWRKIYAIDNFYFFEILEGKDNRFYAVLGSKRLGFNEAYLMVSEDLIHWNRPVYAGIRVSWFYGFHKEKFLYFDKGELKAIDVGLLSVDSDNDGLTDREEEVLFTDYRNPDTDGDGMNDSTDVNPLRKPAKDHTDSMKIRELVVKSYLGDWGGYGLGDLLIVVSESGETQSFDNIGLGLRVLSFNRSEFSLYYKRFQPEKGNIFRLIFDKLEVSKDQKSAVVRFAYYFRPLAAAGYRVRLRKIGNEWVILSFEQEWIS